MNNFILKDSEEPFFSINHLLSCNGRRGRFDFFKIYCFWQIILKPLMFLISTILFIIFENLWIIYILIASFIDLIICYPLLCNLSKRFHDLDCSTKGALIYSILNNLAFYNFLYVNTYYDYKPELIIFWSIMLLISITFFLPPFLVLVFKKGTNGSNQYGDEP